MRKDNTSGTPGVCFLTERNRWQARPWDPVRKRKVWVGLFKDKTDAVKAVVNFNETLEKRISRAKKKSDLWKFLK